MRFASLGSGSRGNATLVEAAGTRVLVDNGFGLRECSRRLARLGVTPDTLSGILLTHEHSDHVSGVASFAARHRVPVYLTGGTQQVMQERGYLDGVSIEFRRVSRGVKFTVGDFSVSPVRVPHDAREPCQYVFEAGGLRLGILTDIGSLTPQVVEAYSACHAMLLECNHDSRMLADGPYHASLKARVGGDFGHLSNAQAAHLLKQVDRERLQHLVLGHLSENNNRSALALEAAAQALDWQTDRIVVATQAQGHDWIQLIGTDARMTGEAGA